MPGRLKKLSNCCEGGMRKFTGFLAIGVIAGGIAIAGDASAQLFPRTNNTATPAAAPAATPAAPAAATPAPAAPAPGPTAAIPGVSPAKQPCNNADALGIGR